MTDKQFLFVCGCPRSGTTAMQWLLNQSPEICLGGERYAHRLWSEKGLTPDLFELDRFFEQQDGDTFYPIAGALYYAAKREAFDQVRFIGDKLPHAYMRLPMFAREFPSAKMVVMLRNIYSVASSYKRRHDDPGDIWNAGGADRAVKDWNNLFDAIERRSEGVSMLLLSHEKFFLERQGFERLVGYLDLDDAEALRPFYDYACAEAEKIDDAHISTLSARDLNAIALTADFEGYRKALRPDQTQG